MPPPCCGGWKPWRSACPCDPSHSPLPVPAAEPPSLRGDLGVPQALAALLDAQRQALAAALPGVLGSEAEAAVHRARVALRRIKALLVLFSPAIPARDRDALKEALQPLMQALAGVRDIDVVATGIVLPLLAATAQLPEAAEPVAGLEEALATRRRAAQAALARQLEDSATASLFWRLDILVQQQRASDSGPSLQSFAAKRLAKRWARVGQHAAALDAGDLPGWHALRLQVKKLRYATRAFGPLFDDKGARRLYKRLTALQDALGRLNDLATAPGLLGGDAAQDALLRGWCAAGIAPAQAEACRALARLHRDDRFWRQA